MARTRWIAYTCAANAALALAVTGAAGCTNKPHPPPAQAAETLAVGPPDVESGSNATEREEVAITVYNQNFGLVREVRRVELGRGRVALEFADVAAHIQPETVHIRALDGGRLAVLEQSYHHDLITPGKLLQEHVGKMIKVIQWDESRGTERVLEAKVLAADEGAVLEIDGEVTNDVKGRLSFPGVPENLVSKPTLEWQLVSEEDAQRIEVTYLTENINWVADYVLVVSEDDTQADLSAWVTLANESGATYHDAKLKLVAGDVRKRRPPARDLARFAKRSGAHKASAPRVRQEKFFVYHLYDVERRTTLRDEEQKQIRLLEATDVRVDKQLVLVGSSSYFRGDFGRAMMYREKVGVYLNVPNRKASGLGVPIPKGTVRVYKADSSGARQFIGEDAIDHTPRGESIRVKVGDAFDMVPERTQTRFRNLGRCGSESRWKIELRNHADAAETVVVEEPASGDWKVVDASHPHERLNARTFRFTVDVPANGRTTIDYAVRVKWC